MTDLSNKIVCCFLFCQKQYSRHLNLNVLFLSGIKIEGREVWEDGESCLLTSTFPIFPRDLKPILPQPSPDSKF
jgi:hypothetical protein